MAPFSIGLFALRLRNSGRAIFEDLTLKTASHRDETLIGKQYHQNFNCGIWFNPCRAHHFFKRQKHPFVEARPPRREGLSLVTFFWSPQLNEGGSFEKISSGALFYI